MSLIVAARFETFEAAENASRELFRKGFDEDDCTIFFVSPRGQHATYPLGGDQAADPGARRAHVGAFGGATVTGAIGAVIGGAIGLTTGLPIVAVLIGAGVGAYLGSLGGAFVKLKSQAKRREPGRPVAVRHAGVLLAVHVKPDTEAEVARTLRALGGEDVEKAEGRWRDGSWTDFDPVKPPVLSDKVRPDHAGAVS
ncbi:hypothetical protein FXN63_05405 [Pigmentiphaga aceris]|uniref:Glycine zipper domain-containing protein n=1 Tax=Pigmentiphaga aceris TaxID=1940612 RepID=A0A5C0ASS9_9BURK|nr:hypothetical protein [Pigmentiphaga aceris]QEI05342.1 hypothetical protein FXN63_05405 [Pigmentiphaga aceris]